MTDRRMISTNINECSIAYRLGSEHPGLMGIAAQRVFMTLILLADDHGNGRFIPANIRVRAFAATPDAMSEISEDQIIDWINIMVDEGAVLIYEVKNQKYYSLTGWGHYQRGNWRPHDSNIPKPKEVIETLQDKSGGKSDPTKRNEANPREAKPKEAKPREENENPDAHTFDEEVITFFEEIFPIADFANWTESKRSKNIKALNDLTKLDKFPREEVFSVLRWMRQHHFWNGVFNSTTKLRLDGADKYRNARGQWESKDKSGGDPVRESMEDGNRFKDQGVVEL